MGFWLECPDACFHSSETHDIMFLLVKVEAPLKGRHFASLPAHLQSDKKSQISGQSKFNSDLRAVQSILNSTIIDSQQLL